MNVATAPSGKPCHPWLADCYGGNHGLAVLPNDEGIQAFSRLGRQAWLSQLQTDLALAPSSPPPIWRLLDSAPADGRPAAIDALLQTPRPITATLVHELSEKGEYLLHMRLPLDLLHFDGHFPAAPVLPGMVQVEWALIWAAPRLRTSLDCRTMEALKFQRLVRPGDSVSLRLRYERERSTLYFAYAVADKPSASGRLIVGVANA